MRLRKFLQIFTVPVPKQEVGCMHPFIIAGELSLMLPIESTTIFTARRMRNADAQRGMYVTCCYFIETDANCLNFRTVIPI